MFCILPDSGVLNLSLAIVEYHQYENVTFGGYVVKGSIGIKDRFSILRKYNIEPIDAKPNQRVFRIAEYNKKIVFRKSKWSNPLGKVKYARFSLDPKLKADLIILTVETQNVYIIPPYNPNVVKQTIPDYKLKPYLNKFDFIELDANDIPKLRSGNGHTPYRGVTEKNGWYYASIILNKEQIKLGRYSSANEAAEVYDKAALFYCPPNLKTNKIGNEPIDERELAELIRNPFPHRTSKRTSNYRGVRKRGRKWSTCIYIGKKQICLGTFENENDAAMAYNDAAIRLKKENAILNDIR